MNLLSPGELTGNVVQLLRTDPRHLPAAGAPRREEAAVEEGFGRLLARTLGEVNDLQHRSMALTQAMITDPDSVDVHDVTIALAEANLSLSITKGVLDRAIQAYREILNLR
jgi:flagellar hook-basal body complex protein FliE